MMDDLSGLPNLQGQLDSAIRWKRIEEGWACLEKMLLQGENPEYSSVVALVKGTEVETRTPKLRRAFFLLKRFLKVSPDAEEGLYNTCLEAFARLRDVQNMEQTMQDLKNHEHGCKFGGVSYGTMIKAYGNARDFNKVQTIWNDMKKAEIEANSVTYGCMLDACVKCNHVDMAVETFGQMKKSGLHKNTVLYTTIIKGFAKIKDLPRATKIYKEMIREGVPCNVVTFNSLIDVGVRCNNMRVAGWVLGEMQQAGISPDIITFSTLVKGFCNEGNLWKALLIADQARVRRLKVDEIMFNSLLDGCAKVGDFETGMMVFGNMQRCEIAPSCVTFSILVRLYAGVGRLSEAVDLVFNKMPLFWKVTPTRAVYSCLMKACATVGDPMNVAYILKQRNALPEGQINQLLRDSGGRNSNHESMNRESVESLGMSSYQNHLLMAAAANAAERPVVGSLDPSKFPPGMAGSTNAAAVNAAAQQLAAGVPQQQQQLPGHVTAGALPPGTTGAATTSTGMGGIDYKSCFGGNIGIQNLASLTSIADPRMVDPRLAFAWGEQFGESMHQSGSQMSAPPSSTTFPTSLPPSSTSYDHRPTAATSIDHRQSLQSNGTAKTEFFMPSAVNQPHVQQQSTTAATPAPQHPTNGAATTTAYQPNNHVAAAVPQQQQAAHLQSSYNHLPATAMPGTTGHAGVAPQSSFNTAAAANAAAVAAQAHHTYQQMSQGFNMYAPPPPSSHAAMASAHQNAMGQKMMPDQYSYSATGAGSSPHPSMIPYPDPRNSYHQSSFYGNMAAPAGTQSFNSPVYPQAAGVHNNVSRFQNSWPAANPGWYYPADAANAAGAAAAAAMSYHANAGAAAAAYASTYVSPRDHHLLAFTPQNRKDSRESATEVETEERAKAVREMDPQRAVESRAFKKALF